MIRLAAVVALTTLIAGFCLVTTNPSQEARACGGHGGARGFGINGGAGRLMRGYGRRGWYGDPEYYAEPGRPEVRPGEGSRLAGFNAAAFGTGIQGFSRPVVPYLNEPYHQRITHYVQNYTWPGSRQELSAQENVLPGDRPDRRADWDAIRSDGQDLDRESRAVHGYRKDPNGDWRDAQGKHSDWRDD